MDYEELFGQGEVDGSGELLSREENTARAQQLRERLGPSARVMQPGSEAERHWIETGHQLRSGCCSRALAA